MVQIALVAAVVVVSFFSLGSCTCVEVVFFITGLFWLSFRRFATEQSGWIDDKVADHFPRVDSKNTSGVPPSEVDNEGTT